MLSNNVAATPRPRPPAQIRRSLPSKAASPPPPYAISFSIPASSASKPLDTLLGSPISTTVQMVGLDSSGSGQQSDPAGVNRSWMNEKSRDELSELLVKADGLIKERENELDLTSAVCKTLYENNVSLKNKHQALLARIPGTPTHSTNASPVPAMTPLDTTPHYYNASLPRSATDSSISGSTPLFAHDRRTRKISVSVADIALLSDQNAELLQKLEKLESESSHADQSGRRALKRLEKEIQTLREELEKTQAKSEELEEKAKVGFSVGAEKVVEEVWRKKKEREARFKAMRSRYGSDPANDATEEFEVRDFAPRNELFSGPSPEFRPSPPTKKFSPEAASPDLCLDTPIESTYRGEKRHHSSSPHTPRNLATKAQAVPQQEYALISQLLLKIRELEETNTRIIEQQAETTTKLQAVQRETELITKVYECLGDQAGVEWEVDTDGDRDQGRPKKSGEDDTIRFQSFRKTLEGELSKLMANPSGGSDFFEGGIEGNKQSTLNEASPLNVSGPYKTRKSVVGLFDTPSVETDSGAKDATSSSKPSGPPIPFPSPAFDSRLSWESRGIVSPALSSLSFTTPDSQCLPELSPFGGPRPTLESELGAELTQTWGTNAGDHHLRTSSLYDLSIVSMPPSPSPMPNIRHLPPSTEPVGLQTPMSMANGMLQLSLDPPTPEQSKDEDEDETPRSGVWKSKQTSSYRRMSQTIRSRTSQWAEGRFRDTLLGTKTVPDCAVEDTEAKEIPRSLTPIPRRLASAFDVVVDTFTRRVSGSQSITPTRSPRTELTETVDLHVSNGDGATATGGEPRGLVRFILEVWLWLQFAIIILVFLWAMAKRGPKAVLSEAEQRRTMTSRR